MEQSAVDKLSAAIKWAAAMILSVTIFKPKVGRYTFTPQKDNWILVGDAYTGRSWSCVTKAMLEDENNRSYFSDFPKSFEGCLAISIPSKVQRDVSYEGN